MVGWPAQLYRIDRFMVTSPVAKEVDVQKGEGLKVFSGTANPSLAGATTAYIGQEPGKVRVSRFQDGEPDIKFLEDVRDHHVVIINPTNMPLDNFFDLLIMIRAAQKASAACVTAVLPYFGCARQDKQDEPRVAITAKLMAQLLVAAGDSRLLRVLLLDLHSQQTRGFFDCVTDHLFASPLLVALFRDLGITDAVFGPPDEGRLKVARVYAQQLNGEIFVAHKKRRDGVADSVEEIKIVGDVKGKRAVIVDDEISTGGTVAKAAVALREAGASEVIAVASHGKFAGNAIATLKDAPVDTYFVGDSIAIQQEVIDGLGGRLQRFTFAPLLGRAILNIDRGKSVSVLFDPEQMPEIYRGRYLL